MKILLLNDDYPPYGRGGGAQIVAMLAHGYAAAGNDVQILTTHQDNDKDAVMESNGIRVTSLALSYRPSLRAYFGIWNRNATRKLHCFFRDREPFDVVHAHNVHQHLTYHALKIARQHGKKLILTFHDVMSISYGRLATGKYLHKGDPHLSFFDHWQQTGVTMNPFRSLFIRNALKRVDVTVAVSDALRDVLQENGIHVDRVIHNGIDAATIEAQPEQIEVMRQRWNLHNRPTIFFGGRLSADKGIDQFLSACADLHKTFPTMAIIIAGDEKRVRGLLQKNPLYNHLSENIIITGWLEHEEMFAALAACDCCVTPSICFDSFPTINLEAMALGKPVIATCYGGSKELVIDEITGFIINPFDIDLFAGKLRRLLSDQVLREKMGAAGKKHVEENFTIGKQIREYLDLSS